MKPLYLVLIGAVVLVVVFLIYRSNKNKQIAAQQAAVAQSVANQSQSGILPEGGSSQVSQVINSLFPYFQTATGLIGSNKKDSTQTKP